MRCPNFFPITTYQAHHYVTPAVKLPVHAPTINLRHLKFFGAMTWMDGRGKPSTCQSGRNRFSIPSNELSQF